MEIAVIALNTLLCMCLFYLSGYYKLCVGTRALNKTRIQRIVYEASSPIETMAGKCKAHYRGQIWFEAILLQDLQST